MSDAMRAINEGSDSFDSVPGIDDDQVQGSETPAVEQPEEQYEPEVAEEQSTEQEAVEQPEQPEARQPDRKGKKSTSKDWALREKRRADKVANDLKARDAQIAEMQRAYAQQQAEIQYLQRQAKLNSNPRLKLAADFLQQGYKPENVDAEAARREAQGDTQGAEDSREVAMHMRNLLQEQAQAEQAQAAQAAETAWREIPYGTHQFDEAVQKLKPGNKEFNDACGWVEINLAKQKALSQDPWDQECARQFSDTKSEFGQRLQHFYQSDIGRELGKNPLGIIGAFELCKVYMQRDHLVAENRRLREQNEAFQGATSPSSGLPVNGQNYQTSLPNPHTDRDGFLNGFEKLGTDRMRELLRSRERA